MWINGPILNLPDISVEYAEFDLMFLLWIWIAVHGVEYAFGFHEHSTTGISEGVPKLCDEFRFRETVLVGKTHMKPTEVSALMEELAQIYKGNAYNLFSKNCNHFCNDACIKLTGNSIPKWVNRLARIGKITPLLFYHFLACLADQILFLYVHFYWFEEVHLWA